MKKENAIKVLNWYDKMDAGEYITTEETIEVYKCFPEYAVYDIVNPDQAMFFIYLNKQKLIEEANGNEKTS